MRRRAIGGAHVCEFWVSTMFRRRCCLTVGLVSVFVVVLHLIFGVTTDYSEDDEVKRLIPGNSQNVMLLKQKSLQLSKIPRNLTTTPKIITTLLTNASANLTSINFSFPAVQKWHHHLRSSKRVFSFSHRHRKITTPTEVPSLSSSLTRIGADINLKQSSCPPRPSWHAAKTSNHGISSSCPNVLIIGARKGGTTSMYQYLSRHPNFNGIRLDWGPKAGETWYFSSQFSIARVQNYLDLFNTSNGRKTGEATVDYLVNCNVPERVTKVCKNLPSIVMLLRDPVSRFLSNFHMRIALNRLSKWQTDQEVTGSDEKVTGSDEKGEEKEKVGDNKSKRGRLSYTDNNLVEEAYPGFDGTHSISRVINEEIREFESHLKQVKVALENVNEGWKNLRCLFKQARNMIHEGAYFVQVMNWLCSYPRSKIMIINSEQFFDTPQVVMNEVLEFLNLKFMDLRELSNITAVVHNRGLYSTEARHQLDAYEKNKLSKLYRPLNQALISLLQWEELQWT